MEDLSGQTIKGYELGERIGAGGFGAVYRARQSTVGREVAIKIILPGYANKPEFIRRFETEAQVVARLEHPHIVPLHDYWRDPTGAYIVMRYLRRGSLKDALKKEPFDPPSAAHLLDQVTSALALAHRTQIIHRDLKPGNILLDEDGNAYLADFGIAKVLGELDSDLTKTGVIGSLDYISPEQARSEPVSPQTDIYSLGVVLYEILTGQHPFPNNTPIERLYKHINDLLPEIRQLGENGIQAEVNAVIQKATAKNPANRYSDALEMAVAFQNAIGIARPAADKNIVEMLTLREQEVLNGIIDGLTNQEIANQLVVTLSTVKWYVNQIYRKLGVRSRVQAIVRARELNLVLPPSESDIQPGIKTGMGTSLSLPEPENPYKGLRPFQSADHRYFFGREKLVNNLVNKMVDGQAEPTERFLAVIGPSGSGKSSVVKAGLIPALWRGDLPGSERWFVVEMLPGAHPLDELEIALMRVSADQATNLHELLERDVRGLLRVAQLILPKDETELVVVIDQFEEVFTHLEDEADRQYFLDLIYTAVTDPRSRVRVVVTMRADFYDRPLHYPEFAELMRNRMETVLPLSVKELELAIRRPAELVSVTFEEGLVPLIIEEAHYQPGALPLLQYALTELFENRQGRLLTQNAYREMGGTVGALAKRADEIFDTLSPQGQEIVRQMFLRLVTLGEGVEDTRRRVERTELLAISEDTDLMDEIIDTYANYRLLSLDNDPGTRVPTVEVAHEAILQEWVRLQIWLDESRSDIRDQRILAHAASEWSASEQDPSFLLRGSRLAHFEAWVGQTDLALTASESTFLETSSEAQRQREKEDHERQAREAALKQRSQHFLQALVGVFAAATIIAIGLSIFAFNAQNTAQQQASIAKNEAQARAAAEAEALVERDRAIVAERNALIQASIGLAAQSQLELRGDFPERAVPLALEAVENYPYTWQAERALGQAVVENRLQLILEHGGFVVRPSWSPDGTRILSSVQDEGIAVIWDAISGEFIHALSKGNYQTHWAYWSPDGRRILTGENYESFRVSEDGEVVVWDAQTGKELFSTDDHNAFGVWSPDGKLIATSGGISDPYAVIWDVDSGTRLRTFEANSDIARVSFGLVGNEPDNLRLVTLHKDGSASIWNVETGEEVAMLRGHSEEALYAYFSPTGNQIATLSYDNIINIWDSESGGLLFSFELDIEVPGVGWSPDGEQFATIGFSEIQTHDSATGELLATYNAGSEILGWDWSPEGTQIALDIGDGDILLWNIDGDNTGQKLFRHNVASGFGFIAFSPDGQRLLSTGGTQVKVWEFENAELAMEGPSSFGLASGSMAQWSPDGNFIGRAYLDGSVRIWDASSGELSREFSTGSRNFWLSDWSPDGSQIFISQINTSGIWDVASGIKTLETTQNTEWLEDSVTTGKWSPDGSRIAITGFDKMVHILDSTSGEELLLFGENTDWVWLLDWSPDGTRIANTSWDHTLKIWDATTGEILLDILPGNMPSFLKWSPDGTKIAVYSVDGILIFDAYTGEQLLAFTKHTNDVGSINWHPSNGRILSSGYDGARVWDAQTGIEYLHMPHPGYSAFSPDYTRILLSDSDGTIRIFPAWNTVEALVAYAHDCCLSYELTPEEREVFGLPGTP